MDVRAGFFGEQNVARDDHLLARAGPTQQAERVVPVALVHHARADERVVLAMIHHRQVEHRGVLQRAPHQVVVLHALPVVGDGDHAGILERADRCQLLAGDALGDRAGDEHVDLGRTLRAILNQRHRAGVVDRRAGVGHADNSGETAARRRRRAGADGLLGRLARLAKVNVNVDQPGADDLAGHIDFRRALRRLARRISADGGHFPIVNQQVGGFIKAVGGIDEAASLEQQRTHGRTG